MPGPLDGKFRVLDLSERSPAAAIAGMLLADLGAEVIRVEPNDGDPLRALPGYRVWFRGQKSVTVGPAEVKNGQWHALRASADVVMTTAQPWIAKPAGLLDGYPDNPRQILSILTALPRSLEEVAGPRHGADHPVYGELVEAEYGLQDSTESERPGPGFLGWPLSVYGAAWTQLLGILGAMFERERFGRGQTVTTSLFDGAAILRHSNWTDGEKLGPPADNMNRVNGFKKRGNKRYIGGLFECADGVWVQIHTGARGAFDRLMKALGRDELVDETIDPAASLSAELDPAVANKMWEFLFTVFKRHSAERWCEILHEADVCCMPALKPGEVLWLKQIEENGMVDIAPDGFRQLGKVVKYSRTPITVGREVPAPGQHNGLLLAGASGRVTNGAMSHTNGDAHAAPLTGARRVGPLDGILVLDFGLFMAGPFANRIFADLGARVIKVEEYSGDPMRGGNLPIYLGTMRGKESLSINLKTEEGRKVVHELVKRADIVHNNMRAGAMDRLGMGYEALRAMNPRIIFCHSSGYGNQGPWSKLAAFEPLHSALGGLLIRSGGEGNPPEYYLTHMDFGCGLTSASMCVAALVERERSGVGQFLEVPQVGAGCLAMSDVHGYHGKISETFPLDHEVRGHAPTNALYRTKDGWITIACYCDPEWDGVRKGLGLQTANWPGYKEARQERLGHSDIARTLDAAIGELTTVEAERRLRGEGVPCAVPRPLTAAEVLAEPSLRSLGVSVDEHHLQGGDVREIGHWARFGTANAIHHHPGPALGEHTVAVLRELGKSDAEIAALIDAKVVNAFGHRPGQGLVEAREHP